jgi:hypothetical protein
MVREALSAFLKGHGAAALGKEDVQDLPDRVEAGGVGALLCLYPVADLAGPAIQHLDQAGIANRDI